MEAWLSLQIFKKLWRVYTFCKCKIWIRNCLIRRKAIKECSYCFSQLRYAVIILSCKTIYVREWAHIKLHFKVSKIKKNESGFCLNIKNACLNIKNRNIKTLSGIKNWRYQKNVYGYLEGSQGWETYRFVDKWKRNRNCYFSTSQVNTLGWILLIRITTRLLGFRAILMGHIKFQQ